MATWQGKPKSFTLERFLPGNYGYSEYQEVDFKWTYGTVSDVLTVSETDKQDTKTSHYGNHEAEALLYTLANWYGTYEGKEKLKELLKDILEAE